MSHLQQSSEPGRTPQVHARHGEAGHWPSTRTALLTPSVLRSPANRGGLFPAGANFYMLNKSTLPHKTRCVTPTCGKSLAKSPNVQHEFAKATLVHKGEQVLRHQVCQVLPTAGPPPDCLRLCSLLSVSIQSHPSPSSLATASGRSR